LPRWKVQRTGQNEWLYVVIGIEPRDRNTGVLGLDLGSGNTRRVAAEEAASRNELAISRRIRLKYDGRDVPGFLLFLPVYRRGAVIDTPEHRLAALQGWVYAPVRIDNLMLGVAESVGRQVDFQIYESDGVRAGTMIYDSSGGDVSGQPGLESDFLHHVMLRVKTLNVFGRTWVLRMSAWEEFDQTGFNLLPMAVLAVGLGFSLLSALLTWALVHARSRALALARDMTADLRRLALLASRTSNGVMLADPERRVEWVNTGFTRMFGYAQEEIKGRRLEAVVTGPETDPATLEALVQATAARQPFMGELLQYTRDGREVWIELEIQPVITERGVLEGFLGLQLDITERRRHAEEMRVSMVAAERASQAKSQFLDVMSHEIRTPMNGIIGMSSLLLDTPLNLEQRETAETIRQSGGALLAIINDVLDYSKIESGGLELERTEFMLSECVEGALDQWAGPAALKQLDLHYEIAPEAPVMVVGDPTRLRQVLVNLLGNAVKFTERGEILLSVRVAGRPGAAADLLIQVRDTGVGIPAEGRARLFKPFSQVDASLTRSYGGIGLGLAICRRLVEMMGGKISVESESGQGSVFTIALRLPEVAAEPVPASEADRLRHDRRILLAGASASGRRIVADMIRSQGMVPQVVETSEQLLQQLRQTDRVDAVLIDLKLADTANRALADRIRELPGRKVLPLILLASAPQPEISGSSFTLVLTKPVRPTQLLAVWEDIFWRRSRAPVAAPAVRMSSVSPVVSHSLRILIAADNREAQNETLQQVRGLGYREVELTNRANLVPAMRRHLSEVVFLETALPGLDVLDIARQLRRDLPNDKRPWVVGVVTGAVAADREKFVQAGLDDLLTRPLVSVELAAALVRARLRLPS